MELIQAAVVTVRIRHSDKRMIMTLLGFKDKKMWDKLKKINLEAR